MIGDVDIRQNHADLHKGLVFREQSQLDHISNARLLKKGEMFRVVDMSLRIQIPVSDFDWMEEFEFSHGGIIPFDIKRPDWFSETGQVCNEQTFFTICSSLDSLKEQPESRCFDPDYLEGDCIDMRRGS